MASTWRGQGQIPEQQSPPSPHVKKTFQAYKPFLGTISQNWSKIEGSYPLQAYFHSCVLSRHRYSPIIELEKQLSIYTSSLYHSHIQMMNKGSRLDLRNVFPISLPLHSWSTCPRPGLITSLLAFIPQQPSSACQPTLAVGVNSSTITLIRSVLCSHC